MFKMVRWLEANICLRKQGIYIICVSQVYSYLKLLRFEITEVYVQFVHYDEP